MSYNKWSIFILFIVAIILFACDSDGEDPYDLIVIGSGSGTEIDTGYFYGSYLRYYDGDPSYESFEGTLDSTSDNYKTYKYQIEIKNIDTIDIYVNRKYSSTQLTVKLYKTDKELAEAYLSASTTGTTSTNNSLTLKYEASTGTVDTATTNDTKN